MKVIKLANGKGDVKVDDADHEYLSRYSWCLLRGGGNKQRRYAQANVKVDGVWRRVLMHRLLMGAEAEQRVDHEDNDGLNNQRGNLRIATAGGNQHNTGPRRGRFKGVCWHTRSGKWIAQIMAGGRYRYLGLFEEEEAAARAYDAKAVELHGEFAKTNFPRVLS